jgi:hypothetical protein
VLSLIGEIETGSMTRGFYLITERWPSGLPIHLYDSLELRLFTVAGVKDFSKKWLDPIQSRLFQDMVP